MALSFSKMYQKATHKVAHMKKHLLDQTKPKETTTHNEHVPIAHITHKNERTVVDLSMISMVKATLGVLIVYSVFTFLFWIQGILSLLAMSFFLAATLNPMVDYFEKKGMSRGLGTMLSYAILGMSVVIIVLTVIPMIAVQGDKLIQQIVAYLGKVANEGVTSLPIPLLPKESEIWLLERINAFRTNINVDIILSQAGSWLSANQGTIKDNLQSLATNFLGVVSTLANGVGNVFLIMILSYFILVDKKTISAFFLGLMPKQHRPYASHKLDVIQSKIGAWVKGQMQLNIIIGLSIYLGLWVLAFIGVDIPYKETLGIIAGITEMIPIVGPLIAALFALLVAASMGPVAVFSVLLLFFLVQQLENNLIVPIVMNHAVGLNPIVIILGMLIGAQFFGLLGLILSIPVATIVSLFVEDFLEIQK